MKTKICPRCKEKKDINEFYKDKKTKDGLHYSCKKCLIEHHRKYHKKYPIKIWCQRTLGQHKHKGYTVRFTFKDLLLIAKKTKYCSICNTKLNWKHKNGKRYINNSPSLDRKDNGSILTLDNVQIICDRCNMTKLDRSMKEFIEYCASVCDKFRFRNKF